MRLETLDYHTAGEPLRIVTGGLPDIPGETMLAKRRFMQSNLDSARKMLMLEPLGHADMYGAVITDPVTPDGDMGAYLKSLRELLALEIDWLAPGHGFLMPQPRRAMQQIIDHRLKREAKVLRAFADSAARPTDALLAVVYDDVPAKLHAMARRSLLAHLHKLRDDGRITQRDADRWALAAG